MPLQLPDLASKTYSDIMGEMLASIPKYSDKWTNLNPSDPGITIVELISWIADMTLYRINRMPEESYVNFLRLIAGTSGLENVNNSLEELKKDPNSDRTKIKLLEFLKEIESGEQREMPEIKAEIPEIKAAALSFLNSHYRAVTKEDFERLAIEATENDTIKVKRAIIIGNPDKVGIIIVSDPIYKKNKNVYTDLIKKVKEYIYPRRLIGTVIDVREPVYTPVRIDLKVTFQYHYNAQKVMTDIRNKILEYLDPLSGGPDGKGWPYDRRLTIYEIDQVVEEIDGVDSVNEIKMKEIDGSDCGNATTIDGSKESIEIRGLVEIKDECLLIEEAK